MHRKSDKTPLLKNNLNILRIGLINDVYPRARFVLVCRSVNDFISSSIHKWETDGSGTLFKQPLAAYHWHIVNLVARYELEIYAPGRYTIIWLDRINSGNEGAKDEFNKLCNDLSIKTYDFDFSELNKYWDKNTAPGDMKLPDESEIPVLINNEINIITKNRS